jgi:hypothetical protein
MSEMIERVARALCVAEGKNPDEDWTRQGPVVLDIALAPGKEQRWCTYVRQARAGIAAMRKPTEVMIAAGNKADATLNAGDPFEPIYEAMIDAALRVRCSD